MKCRWNRDLSTAWAVALRALPLAPVLPSLPTLNPNGPVWPCPVTTGHRVAAIELGKRERPIEINDEFDDEWKRPRAGDNISWEPEIPPLYSNEAVSDSEDKFED
jgi:hypothetical protein